MRLPTSYGLDSGLFLDPNDGKIKRIGFAKGQRKPAPPPEEEKEPPPIVPPPKVKPTQKRVEDYKRSSGTCHTQGEHLANLEAIAILEKNRIVAPARAALIDEKLSKLHALECEASELNAETAALVEQVEVALTKRANLLADLATDTANLSTAKTTLDDVNALSLSDAQLARLSAETRLLPRRITERQAAADKMAEEIKALIAEGQIDGPALVAHMKQRAGRDPGSCHPNDPKLWSLHEAGHYRL